MTLIRDKFLSIDLEVEHLSVRLAEVDGRLSTSKVEHRRVQTELGKAKLKLSSLRTLKIVGKSNWRLYGSNWGRSRKTVNQL